ncbi:hypothetical protein BVC80_9063g108 [Macleaya cordata]|uniref:Thionin-like protein 2 n=1 Tax=Macleaya cordata TaxID=56857 RepID=A0A200PNG0_MACCD|nr:hypothetical protein BVC80_9063g108 [Macleaya cordata]
MEGKNVKPIAVMLIITVLVLGMFVEQTEASFAGCYAKCFAFCLLNPTIIQCPFTCYKECHHHSPASSENDLQYYCETGCASSKCLNISTPQDPRANEMEGCVNSCSEECNIKH